MDNKIILNKLYVLSGPSGSGKTHFMNGLLVNGLVDDAIINVNELRSSILGKATINHSFDEIKKNNINNIVKEMLHIRLSQNLATFLDHHNLSDEVRREYAQIAKEYGMDCEILIFDEQLNNLEMRSNIPPKELKKQLEKFKNTSSLKYRVIDKSINYVAVPNLFNTHKLDVLGDVHGLHDELLILLEKCGWAYDKEKHLVTHEDKERKLLFVGDILDRGTQSVELLKLVKNTYENGQALVLLGNHEEKLLSAYKTYRDNKSFVYKSLSAALTFVEFLKLPKDEKESLYNFLLSAPVRGSVWIDKISGEATQSNVNTFKIGFTHAPNGYFDDNFIPRSLALYGGSREHKDIDSLYEENFKAGLTEHVLMRGHILKTSSQDNVFSLEEDQAFEGNLVLLQLDKYIDIVRKNNWQSKHEYFESSTVKYKTNFNFNNYIKERTMLLKEMNNLVQLGLATDGWRKDESGVKQPHEDGFKVYKYSKQVHFKRLWKENPWLEKARGLVLDATGNIVVHPFDKLYNFGEYDVGQNVVMEKLVQRIEKVNGFLGCISKHPFKDELIASTTGSIAKDAPFVQMIEDFITPELKGRLLNFFKDNNMTLMFEVVHKNDPHIIEYSEKDHGLWLIGARKKELTAKPETETYLDKLGSQLGFRRPAWEEMPFGEVLKSLQTSQLEGYMIRDAANHEPLMKIKTNYYLVTKFVGRMGKNMVKMMFNHSEQFKEQKVDEEFYPIVDKIVAKVSEQEFGEMEQDKRVLFVRGIVNETRQEFLNEPESQKRKNSL